MLKLLDDRTTAIGYDTQAKGSGSTAIGASAKTYGEGQATAIGVNTYANGQSVAVGNDVYATGRSAIAIGNDDIKSDYSDKLPEKTIELIFKDKTKNTAMENAMSWDKFKEKYSETFQADNRVYSPTYAKGNGAISIGSRSIAYSNSSLLY